MRKYHSFIFLCIVLLVGFSDASSDDKFTAKVFTSIDNFAKTRPVNYEYVYSLIPTDTSSSNLHELAKALKSHQWELEIYGDRGITVLESAFYHCLYSLSKKENGAQKLVELLDDPALFWDAAHSLTICDAILRCGKKALPYLYEVKYNKRVAKLCINNILEKRKTAF